MSVEVKAGALFGKYRLERPLGRGGMASVWLARHTLLETLFAVKMLDPAIAAKDPRYVERFMREARLASRIRHPHLVGVYDVGQDPATGLYYLVMEYVPGGNVAQLLAKEGPLPERAALGIVRQVAEALGQAERFGMVHRDIKPDNIMFGERGEAKLSDLGIAKAETGEEPGLTQTAAVFGTPAYMSPEQATDAGKVDARADIYSLGVVCYEMLTGRRPYGGKTVMEILSKIIDKSPPPDLRAVRPDVSERTAGLVRAMMDKEADRRPASAEALLRLLAALGENAAAADTAAAGAEGLERTMPTMAVPLAETLPTQAVAGTVAGAPTASPPVRARRPVGRGLLAGALAGVALVLAVAVACLFGKAASPSEGTPERIPPVAPPPAPEPPPPEAPEPSVPREEPSPPEGQTEDDPLPAAPSEAEAEPPAARQAEPPEVAEPRETPHVPTQKETTPEPSAQAVAEPAAEAPPPRPEPVTLHLLLGTREVTQAEVAVVAEGRPLRFAEGPYAFEALPGEAFEVSVAGGSDAGGRWQVVASRRMAAEGRHVTLPLTPDVAEPRRIQGLQVVEGGRPKASVQGHFRKFGGKPQACGPCTPEELADFLRRNAPGNGNYWLALLREDGSEARFCPSKTPRRAGDAQPYHAGLRLDLTDETAQLYEVPPSND